MPNWVDFIVVIILFRAGYVGLEFGGLAALLQAAGAVSATAITVNSAKTVWEGVSPWAFFGGPLGEFLNFWLLFIICMTLVRLILHRMAGVVKWEKLNWFGQSLGLLFGGLRGVWWVAFMISAFVASGVPYLQQSTQERSLIASRFVEPSRILITRVADRFPGASIRDEALIPSLTAQKGKKTKKRS